MRSLLFFGLLLEGCAPFALAESTVDAGPLSDAASDARVEVPVDGGDAGAGCTAVPQLAFRGDMAQSIVFNVGSVASGTAGKLAKAGGFPNVVSAGPSGPWAPVGPLSSIDFGAQNEEALARAVDFEGAVAGALQGSPVTISGWIAMQSEVYGAGGNRLLSTLTNDDDSHSGLEVVQVGRSLRVGINDFADRSGGPQSDARLAPASAVDAWTFFAVSYDPGSVTDPGDGRVEFFFGGPTEPATKESTSHPYDKGAIVSPGSPSLALGNFADDEARTHTGTASRVPRAKLYGLRVFTRVLTQDEIRCEQRLDR